MGTLYKNGIPYGGGGGGDNSKTITYAEYQNLSDAEKTNGTTYYIPDYPGTESLSGSDVVDNLESTATDLPLSANMGRELKDEIYPNEITVTPDEWLIGHAVYGGGLIIPLQIPYGYTVNVISVETYTPGTDWVAATYLKYEESYSIRKIRCAWQTLANPSEGYPVLCRINATFTRK